MARIAVVQQDFREAKLYATSALVHMIASTHNTRTRYAHQDRIGKATGEQRRFRHVLSSLPWPMPKNTHPFFTHKRGGGHAPWERSGVELPEVELDGVDGGVDGLLVEAVLGDLGEGGKHQLLDLGDVLLRHSLHGTRHMTQPSYGQVRGQTPRVVGVASGVL